MKEFGVSRLLKKKEYPRYHKKKVVAYPDDELSLLYGHANAEERFLMDFFIGSMVRDHEGYGSRYTDVTGVTMTIRGKQHKTGTVEISPRLAGEINERRKRSDCSEATSGQWNARRLAYCSRLVTERLRR